MAKKLEKDTQIKYWEGEVTKAKKRDGFEGVAMFLRIISKCNPKFNQKD